MKIDLNDRCIDCTSDPHIVPISSVYEALNIIKKVCEDEIIYAIQSVELKIEGDIYESDLYSLSDIFKKNKKAEGIYAKKHKIEGLYFCVDAEVPSKYHLSPGLTGVKNAIDIILKTMKTKGEIPNFLLDIGVVWSFVKDSSCADYIRYDSETPSVIEFSNQDWWIRNENYKDYIKKLSELTGHTIEPREE